MFNKLLSNLPYNPSLIHQVGFYAKRLRQESSIRKLGFVFMLLAMSIQMFAFISPPQPTLAKSSNDIIYGGISPNNPKDAWEWTYAANNDGLNHHDIQNIFNAFHITKEDVRNATLTTINSGDHSLYSLGRNTHSNLDQTININGTDYYQRPLYTWADNHNYQALVGTRSTVLGTPEDRYFAIMIDCGNIVVKLREQPKLAIAKVGLSFTNGSKVKRGDTLVYRIFFSNVGSGDAHLVGITDILPAHTTYVSYGRGGANSVIDNHTSSPASPFLGQASARYFGWDFNTMPAQRENWYVDLTVKVNSNAPDGAKICNYAYIRSIETPPIRTNQPDLCYTVEVPKPTQTTTNSPAPDDDDDTTTRHHHHTTTIINIINPPTTTPPPIPVPQPDQPNISFSKRVSNLTKNLNDANNTVAVGGDVLQYQVLTINSGDAATSTTDDIRDNVRDILEYANVIEISDNGKLQNGIITWEKADIAAGSTLTRTFKIQVKNPIPATPRSASDPQSFDLKMDNTYGNTVSVNLPSPTIGRTVELASASTPLPNTGPGTTLAIGFGLTAFIGYFFARNRLLGNELEMVQAEQASGGI